LEPTAGKPSRLTASACGRRRLNGRSLGGQTGGTLLAIDWRDLLLTTAEIAITIAGFSGIIGALGIGGRLERVSAEVLRLRWMLDYSLLALSGSLTPFLVFAADFSESTGWRLCSGVSVAAVIGYSVVNRTFIAHLQSRMGAFGRFFLIGDALVVLLLVANTLGLFWSPRAFPYLASILWAVLGAAAGFTRLVAGLWDSPTDEG
jgi:hypothetical protein